MARTRRRATPQAQHQRGTPVAHKGTHSYEVEVPRSEVLAGPGSNRGEDTSKYDRRQRIAPRGANPYRYYRTESQEYTKSWTPGQAARQADAGQVERPQRKRKSTTRRQRQGSMLAPTTGTLSDSTMLGR